MGGWATGCSIWRYFSERAGDLLSTRSPGYAAMPTLLGGSVGWFVMRRRIPGIDLALAATLIGVGACLGCAREGCGYGREVFWQDGGLGWLVRADLPDAYTLSNPRWPTQTVTAVWLVACACATALLARRREPHSLIPVAAFVVMVCLGDLGIELLRADPVPIWLGLRAPVWLNMGVSTLEMALGFATILFVRPRRLAP